MNADEVVELLGLEPLSDEGGMWAPTWRDDLSSAIYYLMRPGDFSALHRLPGPELWHHYAGAAVEMLLLAPDGTVSRPVLGDNLISGQRPMVAVPAGVWMAAGTTGDWSLTGATLAPRLPGRRLRARRPRRADPGLPRGRRRHRPLHPEGLVSELPPPQEMIRAAHRRPRPRRRSS